MMRYRWMVVCGCVGFLALSGCQKAREPRAIAPGPRPVAAPQGQPVATPQSQPVAAPPQGGEQPSPTIGKGPVVSVPTADQGGANRPFVQYMNSMTPAERAKWAKMTPAERQQKMQEIMEQK
ncbi:MAG: hypothetical protein M1423_02555 [Acidobacteria bacterium]|nr:hypothetical protein [Acidobacteriota bacterium]